ncbi:hypothetical protein D3C76_1444880 [compost metagenome]
MAAGLLKQLPRLFLQLLRPLGRLLLWLLRRVVARLAFFLLGLYLTGLLLRLLS